MKLTMRGLTGLAAAVLLAATVLAAACGDDDDGGDAGNGGGGGNAPASVSMIDFGYEPESFTVPVGQTVSFSLTNDGAQPHTFTIDGVVDSGSVAGGESADVEFTVDSAGELTFYCTVHGAASMSGTVTAGGT